MPWILRSALGLLLEECFGRGSECGSECDRGQLVCRVCAVSVDPADPFSDSAAGRSLTFTAYWSTVKKKDLASSSSSLYLVPGFSQEGHGNFLIQDHLEVLEFLEAILPRSYWPFSWLQQDGT